MIDKCPFCNEQLQFQDLNDGYEYYLRCPKHHRKQPAHFQWLIKSGSSKGHYFKYWSYNFNIYYYININEICWSMGNLYDNCTIKLKTMQEFKDYVDEFESNRLLM